MTPRRRRLLLVCGILAGVSLSAGLALTAFRQNVTFYFIPSQVAAGQVHGGERFRLGGMVSKGSVHRVPGSLEVQFLVTDFKHTVPVTYTGVLPDLFREGQGVIAHGHLNGSGVFVADEVLAKHDEKYMPPEMAKEIKAEHGGVMPFGTAGDTLHTPTQTPPTSLRSGQASPAPGPAAEGPPEASTRLPGGL
jgi:cytochrome c-type biogenesis protein CcmE